MQLQDLKSLWMNNGEIKQIFYDGEGYKKYVQRYSLIL